MSSTMIDDLKSIAIFVETIKRGSFRGAAKSLSLSPSAISYNVAELEKKLGTTLIYRTTRSLTLTSQGESLFSYGSEMVALCERGINEVKPMPGIVKGKLKLSITSALIESEFNNHISAFSKLYPDVSFELSYTDQPEDLIENRIDLAIRAGELNDSTLKSKRLGNVNRVLVCSPDYFASKAPPEHPNDLHDWDWVSLEMMPQTRTLVHSTHPPINLTTKGKIGVNSVVAMTQLCCTGAGLATPPKSMIADKIECGVLIEVLPRWSVKPIPYSAIWPNSGTQNRLTKQFLEHLDRALQQPST